MTEHTELTAELIDRFEAVLSDLGPATQAMGNMVCVAAHAHVGAGVAGGAVAWVRFCSDGTYEGPLMDSDSRMSDARRKCWTPLTIATPSTAQEVAGTMRLGADKLEATRANADFWLKHGRDEPNRDKAVMYVEQSSFAWKNAAYGLAEQLATTESATAQAAMPEEALRHLDVLVAFAYEQGFHELGYNPVETIRAHCLALKGRDENDAD